MQSRADTEQTFTPIRSWMMLNNMQQMQKTVWMPKP